MVPGHSGPTSADLNGVWRFAVDLRDSGEKEGWQRPGQVDGGWMKVRVPAAWDTYAPELRGYEGIAWFRRVFQVARRPRIAVLEFDGAGHQVKVWVNGRLAGEHEGGYGPFSLEVSGLLRSGSNLIAICINHLFTDETIPVINTDWWKFGGITRDVRLRTANGPFLERSTCLCGGTADSPWVTAIGRVRVPAGITGRIWVSATLRCGRKKVREVVPVRNLSGQRGEYRIGLPAEGFPRWSPGSPRLVNLDMVLADETGRILDRRTIVTGVRVIGWEGRLDINGEKAWLRGVNQVEEYPNWTCSPGTVAMIRRILAMKRQLNCNFFRAVHYPHHPGFPGLCDRLGLFTAGEIPMCYPGASPANRATGKRMLEELFWRDAHHPSVIWWSTGNERPAEQEPVAREVRAHIAFMKSLDNTRPALCVSNRRLSDRSLGAHDILALNEYFGVWDGTTPVKPGPLAKAEAELSRNLDEIHRLYPDKPVVITEFGAPAFPGWGRDFGSEYWQAELFRRHTKVFARKPFVQGCTAWCLTDQRIGSYRRYPVGYLGSTQMEVFGLSDFAGKPRKAWAVVAGFYRRMKRRYSRLLG
jgi:beta-glucuronidase